MVALCDAMRWVRDDDRSHNAAEKENDIIKIDNKIGEHVLPFQSNACAFVSEHAA